MDDNTTIILGGALVGIGFILFFYMMIVSGPDQSDFQKCTNACQNALTTESARANCIHECIINFSNLTKKQQEVMYYGSSR